MTPELRTLYLVDVQARFRSLHTLAERAIAQIDEQQLFSELSPDGNSIARLMQHIAGNIRSRWTDFLTSDGEKPDRNRDQEFEIRSIDTAESLKQRWEAAWELLFSTLESLAPRGSRQNGSDPRRTALRGGSDQSAGDSLRDARRADRPSLRKPCAGSTGGPYRSPKGARRTSLAPRGKGRARVGTRGCRKRSQNLSVISQARRGRGGRLRYDDLKGAIRGGPSLRVLNRVGEGPRGEAGNGARGSEPLLWGTFSSRLG